MSEIFFDVRVVEPSVDYWFVRTQGGQFFDVFYENSFIGIGWDEISAHDLTKTEIEIKSKIALHNKIDITTKRGKQKLSDIYNKIQRFNKLKQDDIIVMPSYNSSRLAFGRIIDDGIYSGSVIYGTNASGERVLRYDHSKRRKVEWLKVKPFAQLDPAFYRVRSQHAISNIGSNASYIDSVLYDVYQKNGFSHLVLNIKQEKDINWRELTGLLQSIFDLTNAFNEELALHEDLSKSYIKINVQSNGLFNLKQFGVSLLLTGAALGAPGCKGVPGKLTKEQRNSYDSVIANQRKILDTAERGMKELQGEF